MNETSNPKLLPTWITMLNCVRMAQKSSQLLEKRDFYLFDCFKHFSLTRFPLGRDNIQTKVCINYGKLKIAFLFHYSVGYISRMFLNIIHTGPSESKPKTKMNRLFNRFKQFISPNIIHPKNEAPLDFKQEGRQMYTYTNWK